MPPEVGEVKRVLADTGYAKAQTFEDLEAKGLDLYVAVGRSDNHDRRKHDFRPASARGKPSRPVTDPRLRKMRAKLQTDAGRRQYRKRKQTVEPVFGILKSVLGFRQFLTRGPTSVANEWSLLALAYNFKRLAVLRSTARTA